MGQSLCLWAIYFPFPKREAGSPNSLAICKSEHRTDGKARVRPLQVGRRLPKYVRVPPQGTGIPGNRPYATRAPAPVPTCMGSRPYSLAPRVLRSSVAGSGVRITYASTQDKPICLARARAARHRADRGDISATCRASTTRPCSRSHYGGRIVVGRRLIRMLLLAKWKSRRGWMTVSSASVPTGVTSKRKRNWLRRGSISIMTIMIEALFIEVCQDCPHSRTTFVALYADCRGRRLPDLE